MYRIIIFLLSIFYSFSVSSQVQRVKYCFNHGPYLQEVTTNAATIRFSTNYQGLSWVEVKEKGKMKVSNHYESKEGLKNVSTFNTVNIYGLDENKDYEYRLCSKKLDKYIINRATFGDSIKSPWYSFKTLKKDDKNISFIALSDMHEQPQKMHNLLEIAGLNSADMVFYVGDMIGDYSGREHAFENFIDSSVCLFAKEKPLMIIRGNHETRNLEASDYSRLISMRNGKLYGVYKVGEIMFIILDMGEDKPDDHPYYDGLVDFDSYRKEQADWFKSVVESEEYRNSKWHIVLSHFPVVTPAGYATEYGMSSYADKFLSLFNKSCIDLIVSGHTHEYFYVPNSANGNFQSIINSTETVVRVDIVDDVLNLKVYDVKGDLILDEQFKSKNHG